MVITRIDRTIEGDAILWFEDQDVLLHNYLEQPPEFVLELFKEDPWLMLAALDDWHPFTPGVVD